MRHPQGERARERGSKWQREGLEMSHYMTEKERYQLEAYLEDKRPIAWIARKFGCTPQTIYNERKRGLCWQIKKVNGIVRDVQLYSADKAQQIHDYNQTAKGRPIKLGRHYDYARRLEELMLGIQPDGRVDRRKRYSPYAALIQARKEGYPIQVCVSTLYSYIDKGVFAHLTNKDLWNKGRRPKRGYRPVQRIAHPLLPSITERPAEIGDRREPDHYEMDLVVGRAKTAAACLTMTERQSRREIIVKLPDKRGASVVAALQDLQGLPISSITTDNGPEFLTYGAIRAAIGGGEVYYCHSYAAWEKGTNEVHNRMIRRWYPKGTDFGTVDQAELDELADWLNHYPRRILGGKSPSEVYHSAHSLRGSSRRE